MYGAGHFGKSLMWHGSELLFAFYLTEVCRLAPPLMAAVIAIALFASGLMDVAVGQFLRARVRSVRDAARYQLLGASAAGLAFFLFLGIELLFRTRHAALALAIGLGFRLAYAFYDVPQNAVLGIARGTAHLRAGLSSLRFVCSGAAALAIAAAAALLLAQQRPSAWFAALGAAIGIAAIATSAAFLLAARAAEAAAPGASCAPTVAPGAAAGAPARDGIRLLLGLGFVLSASSAVFTKLEPYFAAYLLASTLSRGALLIAVACGGIASQPITFWFAARHASLAAFRLCAALSMAGSIGFVLLGPLGAAPAALTGFLIGFGLSGLGMLLWTAVANFAAASAAACGTLAPTQAFGLLTFSQKAASALGTLAIGVLLGAHGGPVATGPLLPVVLAMGLAPFGGALICLALAGRCAAAGDPAPSTASPGRNRPTGNDDPRPASSSRGP